MLLVVKVLIGSKVKIIVQKSINFMTNIQNMPNKSSTFHFDLNCGELFIQFNNLLIIYSQSNLVDCNVNMLLIHSIINYNRY